MIEDTIVPPFCEVVSSRGDIKDKVVKIKSTLLYDLPLNDNTAQALLLFRSHCIKEREYMLSLQKWAGVELKDRELAKYFKQQAAHHMKNYRAACLLIPLYCALPDIPGDCTYQEFYNWPIELAPHVWQVIMFTTWLLP